MCIRSASAGLPQLRSLAPGFGSGIRQQGSLDVGHPRGYPHTTRAKRFLWLPVAREFLRPINEETGTLGLRAKNHANKKGVRKMVKNMVCQN